jgi:uncharacterized membrane protein YadS|tara:strand:- start:279 stop:557 length:279 start_codon:yes stop_codon:yes gene_type:complete
MRTCYPEEILTQGEYLERINAHHNARNISVLGLPIGIIVGTVGASINYEQIEDLGMNIIILSVALIGYNMWREYSLKRQSKISLESEVIERW